jgi:hypothetical protein
MNNFLTAKIPCFAVYQNVIGRAQTIICRAKHYLQSKQLFLQKCQKTFPFHYHDCIKILRHQHLLIRHTAGLHRAIRFIDFLNHVEYVKHRQGYCCSFSP